jgi:hypothetical protein
MFDRLAEQVGSAFIAAKLCSRFARPRQREHYTRLRDAWTTLAKRCEPFNFPDVTESGK